MCSLELTDLDWLENANAMFEDNLEAGNWSACEAIIADTKDRNLNNEAEDMQKRLTHERFADKEVEPMSIDEILGHLEKKTGLKL